MNFVIALLIFMSGQNKVEEIIMPPMYITATNSKQVVQRNIATEALKVIKQYSVID